MNRKKVVANNRLKMLHVMATRAHQKKKQGTSPTSVDHLAINVPPVVDSTPLHVYPSPSGLSSVDTKLVTPSSVDPSTFDQTSQDGTLIVSPVLDAVVDKSKIQTNVSSSESSDLTETQDFVDVKIKEENDERCLEDKAKISITKRNTSMETENTLMEPQNTAIERENVVMETETTQEGLEKSELSTSVVNSTVEQSNEGSTKSSDDKDHELMQHSNTPSECSESGSERQRGLHVGKSKERAVKPLQHDDGHIGTKPKIRNVRPGFTFEPGVKVEAMDYLNKWYAAKIVRVDWDAEEVQIHFEGWNARYDEWVDFQSERLRPAPRHSVRRDSCPEGVLRKPGEQVLARWTDCRFYPAQIISINANGSYQVLFYDGIKKTVQAMNIRDLPPSLHDKSKKTKDGNDKYGRRKERSQSLDSESPTAPKRRLSGNNSTPVQSKRVRHESISPRLKGQALSPRSHSSSSEIPPVDTSDDPVCRKRKSGRCIKLRPKRSTEKPGDVEKRLATDGTSFRNPHSDSHDEHSSNAANDVGVRTFSESLENSVNYDDYNSDPQVHDVIHVGSDANELQTPAFIDDNDLLERTLSAVHILGANVASVDRKQHLIQSQLVKLDTVNKRLTRIEQNQQKMFNKFQEMLCVVSNLVTKYTMSDKKCSEVTDTRRHTISDSTENNSSIRNHSPEISSLKIPPINSTNHEMITDLEHSSSHGQGEEIWDRSSENSQTMTKTSNSGLDINDQQALKWSHQQYEVMSHVQPVVDTEAQEITAIWRQPPECTSNKKQISPRPVLNNIQRNIASKLSQEVWNEDESTSSVFHQPTPTIISNQSSILEHQGSSISDIVLIPEETPMMTQYGSTRFSNNFSHDREDMSSKSYPTNTNDAQLIPVPMFISKSSDSGTDVGQSFHNQNRTSIEASQEFSNSSHSISTTKIQSTNKEPIENFNNQVYFGNEKTDTATMLSNNFSMAQLREQLKLMKEQKFEEGSKRVEEKICTHGGTVLIGDEESGLIEFDKSKYVSFYKQCRSRPKPAQAFILKLMSNLFTKEEMSNSSYIGGTRRFSDGAVKVKKTLDHARLQPILAEAEALYGGVYNDMSYIRESINGKCRHTYTD